MRVGGWVLITLTILHFCHVFVMDFELIFIHVVHKYNNGVRLLVTVVQTD